MNQNHRKIGLSLGADHCWPASYEAILDKLNLSIAHGGEQVRFSTERVKVEPFDLESKPSYDLVIDRLTHWFPVTREWMKKITLMDGVYALNNPWSLQSNEKHTSYCAMLKLGYPVPKTFMLPPKEYKDEGDTMVTIKRYNKLFDLKEVGDAVGYPAFIKPYDGGGWVGVKRVTDHKSLAAAYDDSGTRVQHVQAGVNNYDIFVRGLGIGPQVNVIRYDPTAPLHARYVVDFNYLDAEQWTRAVRTTRTINAFFGWDFNSCEMLRQEGVLHPIDFANPCPDSQVTSLHYHFPWLVKALLRWTIFCATTRRPVTLNLNWKPYFDLNDPELPFERRLELYDQLARIHFDAERFDEFCVKELGHLDEVAVEFFSSPGFKEVVRQKVASLYPAHEVEQFTEHFFGLVRFWCHTETDRLNRLRG